MAFPTVQSTNTSTEDPGNTTHTVRLPATVSADDFIVIFAGINGVPTVTPPSGFTEIREQSNTNITLAVFEKKADGTEGGTNVTFSTSASENSAHISVAGDSWSEVLGEIEISTGATGNSTTPDPDSITASWGSDDNLFIAIMAIQRTFSVTGFPTNYADNQLQESTGSAGADAAVAVATRELAASNDDPGTFTVGTARNWVTATMAIRPVAPPVGGIPNDNYYKFLLAGGQL